MVVYMYITVRMGYALRTIAQKLRIISLRPPPPPRKKKQNKNKKQQKTKTNAASTEINSI